jgi:hypothetical protein
MRDTDGHSEYISAPFEHTEDVLPNRLPRTRVLLVGPPAFCQTLKLSLPTETANVVGHAYSVDSAELASASLLPDLTLLEAGMAHVAHRLSEWAAVVMVSMHGPVGDGDHGLWPTVLQLGGMAPALTPSPS